MLLTLIVAVTLAVVLARSLNHSLRRLREGALSVANHDLPDTVKRLQNVGNVGDGGVEEIVRQVRDPIQLNNRDEIGQVAPPSTSCTARRSGSRPSRPRCAPASRRCSSTWPGAARPWSTA